MELDTREYGYSDFTRQATGSVGEGEDHNA